VAKEGIPQLLVKGKCHISILKSQEGRPTTWSAFAKIKE